MATRLPYEPLERILRIRCDSADPLPGLRGRGLWSIDAAAVMLDVSTRAVCRYKAGGLSPRTADELATHVGLHPLEVWGRAWEIAEITAGIARWQKSQDRRGRRQEEAA